MAIEINLDNAINKLNSLGNCLEEAQERFLQSDLYDIFNSVLDTGIRVALPDIAEDVVIDMKDSLMENGFKDGARQIWNNIKDFGKSTLGLVTGKFENIEQVQMATKTGGVLDIISKVFDFALDKAVGNEKITKTTRQSLKTQKNLIVKNIKNKVSESLDNQAGYIEKINQYNEKWQNCFENKDLKGMRNANNNIQKYLEKTLPLENILKNARKIEILQNFVESTGSFDITEEEKELATALSY